ncbi:MAG: hypothetical protein CMH41_00860 [Micrococcales bacterium]|nr:hypothetical protein [Micrococcales bacterium]
MQRILERHGITHASTTDHVIEERRSAPGDNLKCLIDSVRDCMLTWFAPAGSFYIPVAPVNWHLVLEALGYDREGPDGRELLYSKHNSFLNAARYIQDYHEQHAQQHHHHHQSARFCQRKQSLENRLAYHARRYACALQQTLQGSTAVFVTGFGWTRVCTSSKTRPCEYRTSSVVGECTLAWCTTLAAQLTIREFEGALNSAKLMAGMFLDHHHHHQTDAHDELRSSDFFDSDTFAPPLITLLATTTGLMLLQDSLSFLVDVEKDAGKEEASLRDLASRASRLRWQFERLAQNDGETGNNDNGMSALLRHCAWVMRNAASFLRCRSLANELLLTSTTTTATASGGGRVAMREATWQAMMVDCGCTCQCDENVGGGCDCSDYVMSERNGLEISMLIGPLNS